MDARIVVLGSGSTGTLAANRLRRYCDGSDTRITVIDKRDTRDHETEHLMSCGLYGPHALRAPEHLHLRYGIEFRHVEAATVDLDRHEVCLTDGTTIDYDALVVATGHARLPGSPGTPAIYGGAPCVIRSSGLGDESGFIPVDPRTQQSLTHPGIFAVGDATEVPPPCGIR
jgi:NADH dehydrogenase FAD-containing subunit